ncbi:Flp pilus assembly protein CpaB [Spongiactinospora rosea]|uniref:Flp pilus assembly protein CpaB n=1 Tax=Spongiactinospora rosea TaxID=2248750 RepID=A0A366LKX0_9ACTN|nr:Flp pilus assembly protein CpaB [Spongiactinospora rosea]RBQ13944.1 Flp pilus assembly protein CpaB [Spongiactinospora rosea]
MPPVIRALIRRRRLVASSLVAVAVTCALTVLAPAPPETVRILAAARDLRSGPLAPGDLTPLALPAEAVPAGAIRPPASATGKILASPMRRGEPLTDVRLVGPALVAAHPPGIVAAPVRIADSDAAGLLAPGDTIDVLAAGPGWGHDTAATALPAQTVADDVRVITTHKPPAGSSAGGSGGALIVLATTSAQAADLAAAQAGGHLSITIGPRRHP